MLVTDRYKSVHASHKKRPFTMVGNKFSKLKSHTLVQGFLPCTYNLYIPCLNAWYSYYASCMNVTTKPKFQFLTLNFKYPKQVITL